MEIGKEKPARTYEPAEDPFKVPTETPVETPVEAPEREKVDALWSEFEQGWVTVPA